MNLEQVDIECSETLFKNDVELYIYFGECLLLIKDLYSNIQDETTKFHTANMLVHFFNDYVAGFNVQSTGIEKLPLIMQQIAEILVKINNIGHIYLTDLMKNELMKLINYLREHL